MTDWVFDQKTKRLGLASPSLAARLANVKIILEVGGEEINLLEGARRVKSVSSVATPIGSMKRDALEVHSSGIHAKISLDTQGNSHWAAIQLRLRNPGKKSLRIGKLNLLQISSAEDGVLDLGRHPAEYRVLIESGASGKYTGVRSIVANDGTHESKHLSLIYSPSSKVAFFAGQGTIKETWVRVITEYGERDHLGNYTYAQHDRIRRWRIECDFADYSLDPGEEISTDFILLAFHSDPFFLLESYAEAVCKLNAVREFKREDIPVGWMTWYNQESHLRGGGGNARGAVKEAVVLEQASYIQKHLKEYGVNFIEIDEGYERALGDWDANEFVPSGMGGIAKKIKEKGLLPGVWVSPFIVSERAKVFQEHPDWFVKKEGKPFQYWQWSMVPPHETVYVPDPTNPNVKRWIKEIYKKSVQSGYRFFKNDFVDGPGLTNVDFANKKVVRGLKVWREGFQTIREAVGRESHIQPCSGPTIAGVGIIDSARVEMDIGGGVGEGQWKTVKAVARGVACKYYQNRRLFINDPDNLIISEYEQLKSYGSRAKFAHVVELMRTEAQVRASLAVLCGGIICLGDRLTLLDQEQVELIKKCLPVYGEAARPVDMFENEFPEVWVLDVKKPWGNWKIVSLFNWWDSGKVSFVNAEAVELDPSKKYVAWEFWGNEFLGEFSANLRLGLRSHGSKLLRIIEKPDHPAVVGTDMHLIQGGVEIDDVTWIGGSLAGIAARPKGAVGRIFVYVPAGYKASGIAVNGKKITAEDAGGVVSVPLRFVKPKLKWEITFHEAY
jgi:alpha-galactosidase